LRDHESGRATSCVDKKKGCDSRLGCGKKEKGVHTPFKTLEVWVRTKASKDLGGESVLSLKKQKEKQSKKDKGKERGIGEGE